MYSSKRNALWCVMGLAAGLTLPAKAADDAELIAKGKALFQAKICFTCHQVDENAVSYTHLTLPTICSV